MQSTDAGDRDGATLRVTFDVDSDVNIDSVLTQNRLTEATPFLPAGRAGAGDHRAQGEHLGAARGLRLLDRRPLLAEFSRQLRHHQHARRAPAGARGGRHAGVRRERLRDADLGEPRRAHPARADRHRSSERDPQPERGQPRWPDRRRARAPGDRLTYSTPAQGRLETAEQFGAVVVRTRPHGSLVRLGDVARVELRSRLYRQRARFDGRPPPRSASTRSPAPTRSTSPAGSRPSSRR